MKAAGTLVLTRRDVAALISLEECIDAVEDAFRRHAEGGTIGPGILGVAAKDGGFHIKAAGLLGHRPGESFFAAKINGNFFRNPERFGMPAIQGIVLLCDGENGRPLALMDSIEITILRTGAATAVAAKYLARADARVVTICGCGNQGRVQLAALARVRPVERVFAFDRDGRRAEEFAREMSARIGIAIEAVRDLPRAVRHSDICVTCTPSREPLLRSGDVAPGTLLAAVGSDSPEKQELDPALLASSVVVADVLDQCAEIGELHHALEHGLMTKSQVHAELSDVVGGAKTGRTSPEEIIVFDSTGTALEDVAAAALVYTKALAAGKGTFVSFAD